MESPSLSLKHKLGGAIGERGYHMRRTYIFLAVVLATGLLILGIGPLGRVSPTRDALGAEPASGKLKAKNSGTDQLNYKGTVPPGTGSMAEECEDGLNADVFTLTLEGLSNEFYNTHSAQLFAKILWDPSSPDVATSDLALIVRRDGETVTSSDGGTANESVIVDQPKNGKYEIVACAFSNALPQPYMANVRLNVTPNSAERLPKASGSNGLKFMPIVTVDPQRDVAEPSLRIDKAGNMYACGPFGASRAADYAQKSEDGGDTFRVLGEPPEGRIAPGGGGDCEIAVAPTKNDNGEYNLYYVGLEALVNFSTGRSQDAGRTFESTPASESFPAVDRQWLEATGKDEVYLFYNQIPFGGTMQRSTDGGLTYAPASSQGNAAPDINRPGNIVIDPSAARNPDNANNETVYGTYTNGNKVEVFRSADQGVTFKRFTVVKAKGSPDNLFPSIAIDPRGNLYVAWIEKGSFNVYYSFSKDQGKTWSGKQLVNRRGAQTNVMPWIEAGSPGRVAVSFYCSAVDGNPEVGGDDGFRGPWHVCANQSLNGLSRNARFSQVRVTHHPIHWDSICLSGLGCTATGGDRTLLDFFQTRIDPRNGRLFVVFNESNKKPGQAVGPIAIVTLAKQKMGPSLLKSVGKVKPDRRAILRSSARDPKGDARFDFSSLGPPPPQRTNIPSLDVRRLNLAPASIGRKNRPGMKLTMKMEGDLSDASLAEALATIQSQELKFVVRWFSAFRPDFVVANYRPGGGFSFFEGNLAREITADGKLETYPAPGSGRRAIKGKVNAEEGTISMFLKYEEIQDFDLGKNLTKRPDVGKAKAGDKIYEVTAWTFGRPNPQSGAGDYYNQADSTPSFDYRLRRAR